MRVSVTTSGLSITFDPYPIITNHLDWLPDVDIWVYKAEWPFASQGLRVEWSARNIVKLVHDPGKDLLAAMLNAINELQDRMKAPGYNPFDDPDLPADLAS